MKQSRILVFYQDKNNIEKAFKTFNRIVGENIHKNTQILDVREHPVNKEVLLLTNDFYIEIQIKRINDIDTLRGYHFNIIYIDDSVQKDFVEQYLQPIAKELYYF